jgi:hypothetical protein
MFNPVWCIGKTSEEIDIWGLIWQIVVRLVEG